MGEYLAQKETEMKEALIDVMSDPRHFKRVMDVFFSLAGTIEELADKINDLQSFEEEVKELEEIEEL